MRLPLLAAVLSTLPALAQVPASHWNVDLGLFGPTFDGHYEDASKPERFDLSSDLGLAKDGAKPGLGIEYNGPRFGLRLSMDAQDYKGSRRLNREITIDNKKFGPGSSVDSTLKLTAYDLNWTIRVYRWEQAWVGVDLGIHAWNLDMKVRGTDAATGVYRDAGTSIPVPIPQLGLSVGGNFLNGQITTRGSYHFLSRSGATYTRLTADVRYFPLNWVGARLFIEKEGFDFPKGSVNDDVDAKLDRDGVGFGVVFRF